MRVAAYVSVLAALGCAPELGPCDESAARALVYDDQGSPAYEGQALVIASCGGGGLCHSPEADLENRRGAPFGLDYDLRIAEEALSSTDRLRAQQAFAFRERHDIWAQVSSARMPVSGAVGDEVLAAAPRYARLDSLTEEASALPSLSTPEGLEVLRNWLACGLPVVERVAPLAGVEPIGAIVEARDVEPVAASWPDIYSRLVERRCNSPACHGRMEAGDLDLRGQDAALARMIGEPARGVSCEPEMTTLIVPGDPDGSLFFQKLSGRDATGAPVCGRLMPQTGARISAASLANIRRWIADLPGP